MVQMKENKVFLDSFIGFIQSDFLLQNQVFQSSFQDTLTAIVPFYNHEKYVKSRLDSVFNQILPVSEVVILDDHSQDFTENEIRNYLNNLDTDINYSYFRNSSNSGSAIDQWRNGLNNCKSNLIWIAEGDDLNDLDFTKNLVPAFFDKDTSIAYSQSRVIDENNSVIYPNQLSQTADINSTLWLNDFQISMADFINKALVNRNVIPAATAVIFRKSNIVEAINFDKNLKLASDWYAYSRLAPDSKIFYSSKILASHRQHKDTIRSTIGFSVSFLEEFIFVQSNIMKNDFVEIQSSISALVKLFEIILEFIPLKNINKPITLPDFMAHIESLSPSVSRQFNEIITGINLYFKNSLRKSRIFFIYDLSQNDLTEGEISTFLSYLHLTGEYILLSRNKNLNSNSILISNNPKHRLILQLLINLFDSSRVVLVDSTLTEIQKDNYFEETKKLINNSLLLTNGEILLESLQSTYIEAASKVSKVIVTSSNLTLPQYLFESFSNDVFVFNFLNSDQPHIIEQEFFVFDNFLGE